MSLKQSLKQAWNRVQCELDAAGVTAFISSDVNKEMEKDGWGVKYNHVLLGPAIRATAVSLPDITNPQGEKVDTPEQYKEYRDARRAAAMRVYGLK